MFLISFECDGGWERWEYILVIWIFIFHLLVESYFDLMLCFNKEFVMVFFKVFNGFLYMAWVVAMDSKFFLVQCQNLDRCSFVAAKSFVSEEG